MWARLRAARCDATSVGVSNREIEKFDIWRCRTSIYRVELRQYIVPISHHHSDAMGSGAMRNMLAICDGGGGDVAANLQYTLVQVLRLPTRPIVVYSMCYGKAYVYTFEVQRLFLGFGLRLDWVSISFDVIGLDAFVCDLILFGFFLVWF